MRNYCTLFDSQYLPQGLALYESLKRHSSEPFTLYILPMDTECEEILLQMVLPGVVLVHGFHENPEMQKLRQTRTHQEYCWTCASQLAELLIEELDEINYVDADCFFFSDPKVIFDEIGKRSIAVIPHRFIPAKKYLEVNGEFNVSLVHFKKDPRGLTCISEWAQQCRNQCSAKENCGDQKYLNSWVGKYGADLCIIQNIGVGLAPWNLANYFVASRGHASPTIYFDEYFSFMIDVVLYHFHEFKSNHDGTYRLTNYDLREEDIEHIYEPYIEAVDQAKLKIRAASLYLQSQ